MVPQEETHTHTNKGIEYRVYLIMPQFQKVSSKVDGNAAEKVDESSNDPLPHGLERDVKPWLHAVETGS